MAKQLFMRALRQKSRVFGTPAVGMPLHQIDLAEGRGMDWLRAPEEDHAAAPQPFTSLPGADQAHPSEVQKRSQNHADLGCMAHLEGEKRLRFSSQDAREEDVIQAIKGSQWRLAGAACLEARLFFFLFFSSFSPDHLITTVSRMLSPKSMKLA